MPHRTSRPAIGSSNQWLRVVIVAVVLGIALYSAWQKQWERPQVAQPDTPRTEERLPTAPPTPNEQHQRRDEETNAPSSNSTSGRTKIAHQVIRDQNGRVVFRGDVDVGPTLERIRRDQRLEFSHDGIVFQNRERRLPQKPAGYYHEYVHPTPALRGPGPQRIVIGRDSETYYTPDHYRTFQRLDE